MVEAEIPTKASVHLDCFMQHCFRQLAFLSVTFGLLVHGERVMIEFLMTANLAPDFYVVRHITMENAGSTARNIIIELLN